MGWQTVIKEIEIGRDSRIIVVSDIHGNLVFFQELMKKIALSPQDTLVVLGDIVEKGPESLALLNYIMDMGNTHNIHPVCGNCDGLVLRFFDGAEWDGFFEAYLPKHPESTIRQMADQIGMTQWQNLPKLREAVRTHFKSQWDYLKQLPHVLRSAHLLFVHGGVPSLEGIEKLDAWKCMKNDYFWEQGYSFPTYVVVGHCPVTLYDEKIATATPIIDSARKIISIDGGCVLKMDGQLNALLISSEDSEDFQWDYYDGLPTVEALSPQLASADSLNIRWGHSRVEILEQGEELSLCRHVETGRTISILTMYLYEQDGAIYCEDATDYHLPVSTGDILSLCHQVTGGILAKKNGVTGWYWGAYRPIEINN